MSQSAYARGGDTINNGTDVAETRLYQAYQDLSWVFEACLNSYPASRLCLRSSEQQEKIKLLIRDLPVEQQTVDPLRFLSLSQVPDAPLVQTEPYVGALIYFCVEKLYPQKVAISLTEAMTILVEQLLVHQKIPLSLFTVTLATQIGQFYENYGYSLVAVAPATSYTGGRSPYVDFRAKEYYGQWFNLKRK